LDSKYKLSRKQNAEFLNQKKLGIPFSDALEMVCQNPLRGENVYSFFCIYPVLFFYYKTKIILVKRFPRNHKFFLI